MNSVTFNDMSPNTLILAASTMPSWGTQHKFEIKQRNIVLKNMTLVYPLSSVSGLSGSVTNYPNFQPSWFLTQKVELKVNGVTIDVLQSEDLFLLSQLHQTDAKRSGANLAAGLYSSLSARNTLATSGATLYIPLWTFINQSKFAMLTTAHEITLEVTIAPISSFVSQSTLTGTPVVTFSTPYVYCDIEKLSPKLVTMGLSALKKSPDEHRFQIRSFMNPTVQSGVTSCTIPLNGFSGAISRLIFFVRYTNALTGNNAWSFLPISNFNILDSGSESLVGGVAITDSFNRLVMGRKMYESSYLCDANLGTSNSYVYSWVFTDKIQESHSKGRTRGFRVFNSRESLVLVFPSALSSTAQVDIIAYREAKMLVSPQNVKLIQSVA